MRKTKLPLSMLLILLFYFVRVRACVFTGKLRNAAWREGGKGNRKKALSLKIKALSHKKKQF